MKTLKKKHPLAIRWLHWINFPVLFLMIWSGLLIYWSNPVYRIGLLHRYAGVESQAIKLDKLGGKTWAEKRRRVSAEARKIAEELLQLYAQRAALAGHAFPPPDAVYRELEETFPFDETPDQEKAINAVLDDIRSGGVWQSSYHRWVEAALGPASPPSPQYQ